MSSLKERILGATGWSIASYALSQLVRLGSNIILAKVLFEEAFAVMAIVASVLQGLVMFSDLGLRPSVIQNPRGSDPTFLRTVWTIQIVHGAIIALSATLVAWPIAAFYAAEDPLAAELKWLLPLAGASVFIGGFNSTRALVAARTMQVGRVSLMDLAANLLGTGTVVLIASATKSLYAFPVGSIITATLYCVATHTLLRGQRDRVGWSPEAARDILRFGRWVFFSSLISFCAMQVDRLTLPKLFSFDEVGVYSIALTLAMLVPSIVGRLQFAVAFPVYSELLRTRSVDTVRAFQEARKGMLTVAGLLCAGLAVTSGPFIYLAYDERYSAAALYIPILVVGGFFACIEQMYTVKYLAMGRSVLTAVINATKVVIYAGALWAIGRRYGVMGACVAYSLAELGKAFVAIYYRREIGRVPVTPEIIQLAWFLVSTLVVMLIDRHLLAPAGVGHFLRLVICGILVILFYLKLLLGAIRTFQSLGKLGTSND